MKNYLFPPSVLSLFQQQIFSLVNAISVVEDSSFTIKPKASLVFQHDCYKSTPLLTLYLTLALLFKENLIVSQQ